MNRRVIRIEGSIAIVPLTRGAVAVIDAEDVAIVGAWQWQAMPEKDGSFYAARSEKVDGRKTTIRMHRAIMNALPSVEIDHRDLDKLNNRKANLRSATRSQNRANTTLSARNTSGFKGVVRCGSRWRSAIRKNGKCISLGRFETPEAAHAAYVEAAQTLFGEFARSS